MLRRRFSRRAQLTRPTVPPDASLRPAGANVVPPSTTRYALYTRAGRPAVASSVYRADRVARPADVFDNVSTAAPAREGRVSFENANQYVRREHVNRKSTIACIYCPCSREFRAYYGRAAIYSDRPLRTAIVDRINRLLFIFVINRVPILVNIKYN